MIKQSYLLLFSFLLFIFLSCYFVNHQEDLDLFNSKHHFSSSQNSLRNHKFFFSKNQHKEETATDASNTTTTSDATTTATTSDATTDNTTTNTTTTNTSENATDEIYANATAENFTFIWTGLIYSLEMEQAIINADLILNITFPYTVAFYAKSLSNGSFNNSHNLTTNLTYNGSLSISAAGFENYNKNFSFNSSLLTTFDFGQINMSYKWPIAKYTRNLTGQALAEYNCNQSVSLFGVNASITVMIMNSKGKEKSYKYAQSSTRTNQNGEFSTNLPVFGSKTGNSFRSWQ